MCVVQEKRLDTGQFYAVAVVVAARPKPPRAVPCANGRAEARLQPPCLLPELDQGHCLTREAHGPFTQARHAFAGGLLGVSRTPIVNSSRDCSGWERLQCYSMEVTVYGVVQDPKRAESTARDLYSKKGLCF